MPPIQPLAPLRNIIAREQLSAKKSLGQNFILDLNLTAKIASKVPELAHSTILEIGAGPGGLTRGLLSEGAKHVIAVEKDPRCIAALEEIKAFYGARLTIVCGDALSRDLFANFDSDKAAALRIVGNLPYNIATALLVRWLSDCDPMLAWQSLTVMVQKEVGERIIAQPGSKNYGRLSILAQWRTKPAIVMHIPPQAFTPSPKVSSCIVHMHRRPSPAFEADQKRLEHVTRAAFGQRRKMLRTALKGVFDDPVAVCKAIGIEPTARAETLELADFCALARACEASQ